MKVRTIKTSNKKILLRFILGTAIGVLLSVVFVCICAFAATKTDINSDSYFYFLLVAAGVGAIISCLVSVTSINSKRFFISIGQGSVTALLFFLLVAIINLFSITGTAWLIPAVGTVSGLLTGLVLSYIR